MTTHFKLKKTETNNLLKNSHENILKNWKIPKWANIPCPNCNLALSLRSICEIGICFNPKNLGRVFVDCYCEFCCTREKIFFVNKILNLKQFISIFKNGKPHLLVYEKEDAVFKSEKNNLIDLMNLM